MTGLDEWRNAESMKTVSDEVADVVDDDDIGVGFGDEDADEADSAAHQAVCHPRRQQLDGPTHEAYGCIGMVECLMDQFVHRRATRVRVRIRKKINGSTT